MPEAGARGATGSAAQASADPINWMAYLILGKLDLRLTT